MLSMSSSRSSILPPPAFASSHARNAAQACPRWSRPVGEGAKRVSMAEMTKPDRACLLDLDHPRNGRTDGVHLRRMQTAEGALHDMMSERLDALGIGPRLFAEE